ncbi:MULTISPECIES: DUF1963 domain-containing protein [unclassified Microbacterium]|uniref:DUF1963 domain-containing protein n=1 Tax=unclassified Microbacterium TaxID=2609290 RepID=UPI003863F907
MTLKDEDRPPIHGWRMQAIEWLERDEYAAARLGEDIAFTVAYSEQSCNPGMSEVERAWGGGGLSWVGGPAGGGAGEPWPRRHDGRPLAHVATFDLADARGVIGDDTRTEWPGDQEGLPEVGVLEVFHDCETFGHDPAEADHGAWHVRWVPAPDRSALDAGPADRDNASDACQAMLAFGTFSVRSADDFLGARSAELAAAEAANDQIQRMWSWQRTLVKAAGPRPITHLYGHSQHGDQWPMRACLPHCIPLAAAGDRYRLIAEIESSTSLAGWFGDAGSLEVWMRASDLEARAFDQAWCLIRDA